MGRALDQIEMLMSSETLKRCKKVSNFEFPRLVTVQILAKPGEEYELISGKKVLLKEGTFHVRISGLNSHTNFWEEVYSFQ